MDGWALFMLAGGLSMDACAAAVCKGIAVKKLSVRHMAVTALWFGIFQGAMPVAGYLLGVQLKDGVAAVARWLSFAMLEIIGANMVKEACGKECLCIGSSFAVKAMLPLALATSLDAFAAGVTFAFLAVEIWPAAFCIGGVTFASSMAGMKIGNAFGVKYKAKAEITGGGMLMLLGLKVLSGHFSGL